MELHLIMPTIETESLTDPAMCPYCNGKHLRLQQKIKKTLRDIFSPKEVIIHRYQCLVCRRTFRVYPQGVTNAQISQRVRGYIVSLYLMGCSYRDLSLLLPPEKSQIHNIIKSITLPVSQIHFIKNPVSVRNQKFDIIITLKCSGRRIFLDCSIQEDGITLITIDLNVEEQKELKGLIAPIAEIAGAEVVVTSKEQ